MSEKFSKGRTTHSLKKVPNKQSKLIVDINSLHDSKYTTYSMILVVEVVVPTI